MIEPWPDQIIMFNKALPVLKEHMIVYLAGEERTGKTVPAIMLCEAVNVHNILIVTKKKALDGWNDILSNLPHTKKYTLVNYHKVHKLAANYDLVILDESHNYISGYPKKSAIWDTIARVTNKVPIVYCSATPYAQTPALLYHQFALSYWSPFIRYANYYSWWRAYGTGETIRIGGGITANSYDKVADAVVADTKHLFITITRKELGFAQEPVDKLHYIELDDYIKPIYNKLLKHKIIGDPLLFVADTVISLRVGLHQLEGGTLKTKGINEVKLIAPGLVQVRHTKKHVRDDNREVLGTIHHQYFSLPNREKIEFILEHFGDNDSTVIMYNYQAEGFKLKEAFKNAVILQATSNAEGVDLSMYDDLIIYSQDFSTARHAQRRARQANRDRCKPIIVHYLLVRDGISDEVYETVSINKLNYVDSVFKRTEL